MMKQDRFDIELDPFELAKKGRSFSGQIASKDLSRVVDLVGDASTFDVELDFGIDMTGLRIVKGRVHGKVSLQCQRCLESFQDDVDLTFKLALVRSESQIAALPGEYEPLLVEDELLLIRDIVEDEIILAVPVTPTHAEDACSAAKMVKSYEAPVVERDEQTQRPFANLADLVKQKK